eukprot:TRINITY_DN61592_c0_g1_i1.p1 TRINITY_DN61592_c0_g1~~TRINITY_DN61592_c0_g1_i1.p1  ORF type:complete len:295 (+),score=50.43 TRINITY_DN61592_c0_g1_i1:102-986(+)
MAKAGQPPWLSKKEARKAGYLPKATANRAHTEQGRKKRKRSPRGSRLRGPREGKLRTGANTIELDDEQQSKLVHNGLVTTEATEPEPAASIRSKPASSSGSTTRGRCAACSGSGTRHGSGKGKCGLCWGSGYRENAKPPELRGIHRTMPDWHKTVPEQIQSATEDGEDPDNLPPGWQEDFDEAQNAPFYWHEDDPENPTWEHPRCASSKVQLESTMPSPSRSREEMDLDLPEPENWTQEDVVSFLRHVGLPKSALDAGAREGNVTGTVDCRTLAMAVRELLSLTAEKKRFAGKV